MSKAAQPEDISDQVNDMNANPCTQGISRVAEWERNLTSKRSDNNESYHGGNCFTNYEMTSKSHPKGRPCPA